MHKAKVTIIFSNANRSHEKRTYIVKTTNYLNKEARELAFEKYKKLHGEHCLDGMGWKRPHIFNIEWIDAKINY